MALIECKECGQLISSSARSCPNCGFVNTVVVKSKSNWVTITLSLGAIALFVFFYFTTISESSTDSNLTGDEPLVTMAEYNAITIGMSYQDVCGIVGGRGKEAGRNKIEGVPGVMESVETIMYEWNNELSGMNAIFQNNELTSKAQFGLE